MLEDNVQQLFLFFFSFLFFAYFIFYCPAYRLLTSTEIQVLKNNSGLLKIHSFRIYSCSARMKWINMKVDRLEKNEAHQLPLIIANHL